MPEALTMNSSSGVALGASSPRPIWSAWSAFHRSTAMVSDATSSVLLIVADGVNRPVPVITTWLTGPG
jgi:hypothetical protein